METVVYTFCAYLPIHLLAYLPFLDLLRFGRGWMAATVTGNMAVHLLGVAWAVAAFLAARLFHAGSRSLESGLLCLGLCALAALPMYRLFRYAARQVFRMDAPRLWRVIWLLPAMMSAMVTVFTGSFQDELVGTWQFLFTRTSLLLCVVVVYWVLLSALEGLRKQAALEEQLRFEASLLEIQITEQKKYSRLMVEHAEDLRRQLTAIQSLTREDNAPLRAYLDDLLDAIPAAPQIYCENQAVNAIVSHYAALCREQGVEADIRLTVPGKTEHVTDAELCVIFGNLLENALEACARMTEGRKFIRLHSTAHLGILTVTLDNSFDGQARQMDGKFRSSKRDDFGVGLASIQAVARRRGGDARFEPDGRVFRSSVYVRV